jgi:hypothetical protein
MKKIKHNHSKKNQNNFISKKVAPLVMSTTMLASAFLMAGAPASALASEDSVPQLHAQKSESMGTPYGSHGEIVSTYAKSIEGSPEKGIKISTAAQGDVETPAEEGTEVEVPTEEVTDAETPAEVVTDAETPVEEGSDAEAPEGDVRPDWSTDTYRSLIGSYMTLVDYYKIYIGQYLFADVVEPEQETTVHEQFEMEADLSNTVGAELDANATQVDTSESHADTEMATSDSQVDAVVVSSDNEANAPIQSSDIVVTVQGNDPVTQDSSIEEQTVVDLDTSVKSDVYEITSNENHAEGVAEGTVIIEEVAAAPTEDKKDQVSSNIEVTEGTVDTNEETVVQEEISITETTTVDSETENKSDKESNQNESVSISIMDKFVGYFQQILGSYEKFASLFR